MGNIDNRASVTLDGREFEVIASLGACEVYRNEFWGKLDDPYVGVLDDDLLTAHNGAQRTMTITDKKGKERIVPNPAYRGADMGAAVRFLWAMARAAGLPDPYADFEAWVMAMPMSFREQGELFAKVIYEVAAPHYFRQPAGHADAGEPDEGQEES